MDRAPAKEIRAVFLIAFRRIAKAIDTIEKEKQTERDI
jgi:hypothetical protein